VGGALTVSLFVARASEGSKAQHLRSLRSQKTMCCCHTQFASKLGVGTTGRFLCCNVCISPYIYACTHTHTHGQTDTRTCTYIYTSVYLFRCINTVACSAVVSRRNAIKTRENTDSPDTLNGLTGLNPNCNHTNNNNTKRRYKITLACSAVMSRRNAIQTREGKDSPYTLNNNITNANTIG